MTALGGALVGVAQLGALEPVAENVPVLSVFTAAASGAEPEADRLSGVALVDLEPEKFDATALLKSVAMTERKQAEAAAAQREAGAPRTDQRSASTCAAGKSGFGTVRSWVAVAGTELRCKFDVDTVHGVAGRAGASDHPSGLALDLMVGRDPGDDLAAYAVKNMDRLGIKYVIYRQRINFGSGWQAMEDRGGATANHMDHVHVSFDRRPPLAARA